MMTPLNDDDHLVHSWPAGTVRKRLRSILREMVNNSQARAAHPQADMMPASTWPDPTVSTDAYEEWRSLSERGEKYVRPGGSPANSTQASRAMRRCHRTVQLAVVAEYVCGSHMLLLPHGQGLTIPLDILDSVQPTLPTHQCFGQAGPTPALTFTRPVLSRTELAAIRRLAHGRSPDFKNGIGHHAFIDMLKSIANDTITLHRLQVRGISPTSPEGLRWLRRPDIIGLDVDDEMRSAIETLRAEAFRRGQAALARCGRLHPPRGPRPIRDNEAS